METSTKEIEVKNMGIYIGKTEDGNTLIRMKDGILLQEQKSYESAIAIDLNVKNITVEGFNIRGTSKIRLRLINWILNFNWKFWK